MSALKQSDTKACEEDGCFKRAEELHYIAKINLKTGEDTVRGICPSCYFRWCSFKAQREAAQTSLTKAFGDYKTAQKAVVKIGSIEVKGQYRGANFYPYYHLVKKNKLKFSYAAESVELVNKY